MRSSGNLQRVWPTKALGGFVLVASMIASYTGVSVWWHRRLANNAASNSNVNGEVASTRVNPFASANGTHLIAFVVMASDCPWSKQPAGMEAIRSLRAKMRAVHGRSYAQVNVVGVALDTDLDAGLRFLSDVGKKRPGDAFDQVVVGGSWLNEQIVRFVWRERVTEAAIPQALVIERPVNTDSYLATYTIGVQDDRVVAHPKGATKLITWINQGVPLNKPTTGLAAAVRPK
jgi:hypothetical protein